MKIRSFGKNIHVAATLLLTFALFAGTSALAFAEGTVDFNGQSSSRVWSYDSVNVRTYGYDAFGDVTKDLYPGAKKSVHVRLRNNTTDRVAFRLAVNPLTDAAQKANLEKYYEKTANDGLLDLITIVVRHGTTQLYNGNLRGLSASASGGMYHESGALLGTVSASYSGNISVELGVPENTGNAYMNALCAIEWRFIATQYTPEPEPPKESTPEPEPPKESTPKPEPPKASTPSQKPQKPEKPPVKKDGEKATGSKKGVSDKPSHQEKSSGGKSGGSTTGPVSNAGSSSQTSPPENTPPVLDDVPVSEVPIPEEGAPAASGSPDGSDGAPVEVDADLAPADQGDDGPKTWSFLNLIFTILVGVQMLLLGMRWIAARSSEKALYDHRPDPNRQTTESEENKNRIAHSKRKLATSLFALAGTVALIVLFAISENLSMPMELINRYTVCYVLINAAIAALAMLTDPSILKRRGNN